ncbi:DNA-binding HxlR family transcriptional regulator [Rhodoligotrophos appendicifer]|uniref:winged helix-turn-helix transcriptional regulator n=1 Tax=Rhodoligotrophos appendicifer TaxID=987056 RepID=UPI001961BC25|nr:helix-turn-helix domain-containing protein [Rhodoligotrophos appendicifer]
MDIPNSQLCMDSPGRDALVRQILERIADKWTPLVIDALEGENELRFSRLREQVPGISQKMLTKTLRVLERDGLVSRVVHPVVPPRVEYTLTALGESLAEAVCSIWVWAGDHLEEVERARSLYGGGAAEGKDEGADVARLRMGR